MSGMTSQLSDELDTRMPIVRAYCAGDYTFSIEVPSEYEPGLSWALTDLRRFEGLPSSVDEKWTVEVYPRSSDGAVQAHVRVSELARTCSPTADSICRTVVSMLNHRALVHHPDYLHIHAAGLVIEGVGVLIVGSSGAGKSTLTAALLNDGADYISDETARIDPQTLEAHGFSKPISIKRGSQSVVSNLMDHPPASDVWQVPASKLGSRIVSSIVPTVIINYQFDAEQPTELERIHRSRAVARMGGATLDLERFGLSAIDVIAKLVERASCWQLRASSMSDAVAAVRFAVTAEFSLGSVSPLPDAVVRPSESGPTRHHRTRSVILDGQAVILASNSTVTELDSAGTVWWKLLDGTSFERSAAELAESVGADLATVAAGGRELLDELNEFGLVDGWPPEEVFGT